MAQKHIQNLLDEISKTSQGRKVRIMNFCGTHEYTIAHSGMRSILPRNIELIPGPGCPVCICPQEDIRIAIELSLKKDVVLLSYGDMLRVPVHGYEPSSLLSARSRGADVRFVGSPLEAITLANENPQKEVVFFSVGFETTTGPLAGLLYSDKLPPNLSFLVVHRLTPPVLKLLLEMGDSNINGVIAPGHVSSITGEKAWAMFPGAYKMPICIAGFEPEHVFLAIRAIIRQIIESKPKLENVYKEVVTFEGNTEAQKMIGDVFDIKPAWWRGVGEIPSSGYELKEKFAGYDARKRFEIKSSGRELQEFHPACSCHLVVMGKIYPSQCKLFGNICTPDMPFGPCMVSQEGPCKIWWKYRPADFAGEV
jgi:hydrogenase expression/formation protein HypD